MALVLVNRKRAPVTVFRGSGPQESERAGVRHLIDAEGRFVWVSQLVWFVTFVGIKLFRHGATRTAVRLARGFVEPVDPCRPAPSSDARCRDVCRRLGYERLGTCSGKASTARS